MHPVSKFPNDKLIHNVRYSETASCRKSRFIGTRSEYVINYHFAGRTCIIYYYYYCYMVHSG